MVDVQTLLPIYMMRVATALVIVALLSAAVTAASMKRHQEDSSCIETFIDLEESLVKRNSNINHLHNAFFPSNQQFPVAVDLLVHFSTSLQNTSHKLCSLSTARLDNHTSDYKFRWSASATLLFLQPEILRPLSLFVYRGIVSTAEVVIDPMCADLDNEVQQMKGKVCKESTNEEKPEELLNRLCIHVSTYLNLGLEFCSCMTVFYTHDNFLLSLVPRLLCGGGGERAWYTLRMRQVSLVTCILLHYTKNLITANSVYLLKGYTAELYSL